MIARLVFAVALLGAHEAAARVVLDPPVVRRCPPAREWSAIMTCLAKAGTVKVLRQQPGVRLVQLAQPEHRRFEAGLILYIERANQWRIGGLFQSFTGDTQLLGFERIKIGKHHGYRIDVGQASSLQIWIDEISPVPALMRTRHVVFCSGKHYRCADITTDCEVLVRGKARFAVHGRYVIHDGTVLFKGDRSRGGPHCKPADGASLDWDFD